jgi:hypothetical protein
LLISKQRRSRSASPLASFLILPGRDSQILVYLALA